MPNALRFTLIIVVILILVLIITVIVAAVLFNRHAEQEARQVLSTASPQDKEIIQQSDLEGLPPCVQKWMERSGVVGQEKIHTVRLTQTGRMRNEEGKPWMPIAAVQYTNVDRPGFVWIAKVKAAPLINLYGRDKYYQGHGNMLIKLLALIPVVNAQPCRELDQGAMLRFLCEMIWYPSAAINDYIKWEDINAHSAKATMTWQGVSAFMVFNFNEQGDMISNIGPRYQEVKGDYILNDWSGVARQYREFNGIRILNQADVIWRYKTGDFNWLQIEVTDIDYNPSTLY